MPVISIDEIEQLLDEEEAADALKMVVYLNASPVISRTLAWHDHYPYLYNKYLRRKKEHKQQQNPPVQSTVNNITNNIYSPNSTHNDNRRQLITVDERPIH
ncbi:MAG: hypothetical protein K2M96_10290 [Prevotella sp.]|nr:hypothetical protein [Prevotella sp.]